MVAQKTCLRKSNNPSVLGGDKRSLQTTLSRKLDSWRPFSTWTIPEALAGSNIDRQCGNKK